MNLNPLTWFSSAPEAKTDMSLDTLIRRLESQYATVSNIVVTPETCMQSPTVNAIVTAVSRRLSVSPVRVMRRTFGANGRERKELLPSHPVARLLSKPNSFQSRASYWLDAGSCLMRYGRFFAFKAQGNTGPIRRLIPLDPSAVTVQQDDQTLEPSYRATLVGGRQMDIPVTEMHHVRGSARDFLTGDSTVMDVRESIALEIAMEKYGASFFGNGAMPLLVFQLMQGFQNFKTKEEETAFLDSVAKATGGNKRHSSFLLPKGMEMKDVTTDNEKSQFIDARKYQRTVIAGAFGVPPHFVGDLERATFNNVEQQDTDFVINVVMPQAQVFESAMERDLLTDEDRRDGVIIRFNLDAVQRADFKTRQEGMQIKRQNGVINANDWREAENMNPISDEDGGEDFIRPANFSVAGEEPPPKEPTREPNPDRPA
jgi:HK97 family phage portal protein